MNDLTAALFFLACLVASVGLAKLCERLMPHGKESKP